MDSTAIPPPIPESQIHPDVTNVLEPGEHVLWQEKPPGRSLGFPIVFIVGMIAFIAWQEGLLQNPAALIENAPLPAVVFLILLPIVLIGGFIGVHYYRKDATVYVLTSERVMCLFKGRIAQQATPEKLQFRGSPRSSSVRWYNVDFPPDSHKKGRPGFSHVEDGKAVYRLLDAWQKMEVHAENKNAEASSDAFRQQLQANEISPEPHAVPDTTAVSGTPSFDSEPSASVRTITHSRSEFRLDVPASWELQIGKEYDGPLKILGITLIKRVIKPATLRPYEPGTDLLWNRLTLRGGPSTGLTIKINPAHMPDENEVLNDRWGQMLGVDVKFFERDIDINGFRGFAAVRELPAGSSPMGFDTLPLAVISRQWWFTGHGLDFEIQGIAPLESTTLQDTIDLTVASLRPAAD